MDNQAQPTNYWTHYPHLCCICNKSETKEEFYSMCHKWRECGGYSSMTYPRYTCSKKCLDIYEKNERCNHCHIVKYDWNQYIKGSDGFTYCNNKYELTVGDKPCYYIKFNLPYNYEYEDNEYRYEYED